MANVPTRFVFIATGGMLPPETVDFAPMARARMVSLVNEWNKAASKKKAPFPLPTTVQFVHFDFDSGAVTTYDHAFPDKGTKAPSLKNSDWVPATAAQTNIDTTLHDNNLNKTQTLSITNIYASVRKSPPDSVMEVSIFSHAFVKGPVVINTNDNVSTSDRTPKDMDGRARTDFNPNMGDSSAGNTALDDFIKAFDKKGHFRVYGCNVQDVVNGSNIVSNISANGAVRASNSVTITTTVPHGLALTDNVVTINEVPDGSFNGTFSLKTIPSPTTFTYDQNGPAATSGGGIVSKGGVAYKRSAVFQIIDQAFRLPTAIKPGQPVSAAAANLKKGKAPTSNVVLDMWGEVMNEAERDVKDDAIDNARKQPKPKPKTEWKTIAQAAWDATPTATRNKLANALLIMHRQLDPDFYPPPNMGDVTAVPAQKTVSKSWDEILTLVANKIAESYIFKAADKLNASGITCHGAVPGVGGNNETDPRHLGLMRVCDGLNLGCETSYGAWLKFYKDFFFLDTDGKKLASAFDDRNYAQFDSDSVPIVKAHATP